MRVFAVILAALLGAGPALAQDGNMPGNMPGNMAGNSAAPTPPAAIAKPKPKPKPARAPAAAEAAATATPAGTTGTMPTGTPAAVATALRESYTALPAAERIAIQSDLVWTGDYNGLITGEFSDRLVSAVKAFQKRMKGKETGVLNPQERAALTAAAKPLQDEVGWRLLSDQATGVRLGLPGRLATQTSAGKSGTRWMSAQGQLQIETFRSPVGTTLAAEYEQQRKDPVERRVSYNVLRPDFFVVSGTQGLKKFYVRASAKDGEVRGIAILYDQAMEGTMDPMVVAMSSAFIPFASDVTPDGPPPRRRVEYGTGVVVSAAGHIVTDRQVVEACSVIVIPGLGHAERLAQDKAGELALLRVYGARNLVPMGLLGPAQRTAEVALVGIADPQTQGGNAATTAVSTRLGAAANPLALETAPAPGFSGGGAIDRQGHFLGVILHKPSVLAGPAAAAQAMVVPAETVRNFLEANYVAPASGRPGVENAKASMVRVICVRK